MPPSAYRVIAWEPSIGEITNSAEYLMDKQNQNLPIFEIKLRFSELKKKFLKFPKFYNFENNQISIIEKLEKNNKISEIVEFQKLANFQNLTICKTIKILKNSNLVNYHKFWVFEQFKQT